MKLYVGNNPYIQATLSPNPIYGGNYALSFNIPYATAQKLAPYEKAFSNAYFNKYPEILPATPYINTNNYITNTPGNIIVAASGLLNVSGVPSNVNDIAKVL